jgi:hypothetical protein
LEYLRNNKKAVVSKIEEENGRNDDRDTVHCKDFGFLPQQGGQPLECFEQRASLKEPLWQ